MARVLVVDDDEQQLRLRRLTIETEGHQVWTAHTAAEATRLLEEIHPNVLVMDLCLPTLKAGLALLRSASNTRTIVLSGWTNDLLESDDATLAARVFSKPVRTEVLLGAIRELAMALCFLALAVASAHAQSYPFRAERPAEVVAEIEMSSPGSDWAQPGREAALATLVLDGKAAQHVMLYAGEERYTYSAFLGNVAAGEHRLAIERNAMYSAKGSGLEVHGARFRQIAPGDSEYPTLARAPILYARADTVGSFTDIPMLAYCERLADKGRPLLQYTMIFSNEDGGTATRALMARWGRTTDIEYIYKAWLNSRGEVARATIQVKDHKEIEFAGRYEGTHPVLIPSTRNNMVADVGTSPIRYQVPPELVDLSAHSREEVLDRHPIAYRVMAQELAREGKLRPFGVVDGEKVSDPRNYLYIEAQTLNRTSALNILVRLENETIWRAADLGRADYAISRNGWFRSALELPPGTRAGQIAEIGFECRVAYERPEPLAGVCSVAELSKAFLLTPDYRPGPSLFRVPAFETPAGAMRVFRLR